MSEKGWDTKEDDGGKDFVYNCVDKETGNTITVRISKEKEE